jgi:hypothetical protein
MSFLFDNYTTTNDEGPFIPGLSRNLKLLSRPTDSPWQATPLEEVVHGKGKKGIPHLAGHPEGEGNRALPYSR